MSDLYLGPCEFNGRCRNNECPFIGVVEAASAVRIELALGIVAPCPQVVASLYEVSENDIVVPGKVEATPSAFALSLGLVQIHRDRDRYPGVVHNPDDGLSAFLR